MTREQAINSMISHGFKVEQVGEIIKAVTPQFSSELEKNSKKLEKDFGELDCISREQALNEFCIYNSYDSIGVDKVRNYLKALPSVTPQKQQTFKWCTDCKEYDQEKHCCHRWSKVIRNTVEEMKQEQEPRKGHWLHRPHVYGVTYCSICDFELKIDNTNYCPNCGADMRGEEV